MTPVEIDRDLWVLRNSINLEKCAIPQLGIFHTKLRGAPF